MLAVLFGVLAGALFGVFTLAVRAGLIRGADPEAGALVITGIGFLTGGVLALPELASGTTLRICGPCSLIGALVPGISRCCSSWPSATQAPRGPDPDREAPLISVALALSSLGRASGSRWLAGHGLDRGGGDPLAGDARAPPRFRALGAVLALTCASLLAVRDNAVRSAVRGARPSLPATSASLLVGGGAIVL